MPSHRLWYPPYRGIWWIQLIALKYESRGNFIISFKFLDHHLWLLPICLKYCHHIFHLNQSIPQVHSVACQYHYCPPPHFRFLIHHQTHWPRHQNRPRFSREGHLLYLRPKNVENLKTPWVNNYSLFDYCLFGEIVFINSEVSFKPEVPNWEKKLNS
jgi:hypothetical protein